MTAKRLKKLQATVANEWLITSHLRFSETVFALL